ncbi:MAG: maleylpyruvate isomerase family mycothiol-dependent enzyme [Frankiaceae bacterium]
MSNPSYAEYVAVVRREGASLAGVGRLGVEEPVPTCPGWTVGRLLLHVGSVYRFAAEVLETRANAAPERPQGPAEGTDPVEYLLDGLDEIVTALGETDPDTPLWNWSVQPDVGRFWARRMAHESLIHRIDAKLAHDVANVIDADLAVDGVDELFDTMAPRTFARGVPEINGILHLAANDADARWTAKMAPDSIAVSRGPSGARSADVTLRGKASDLLLVLYNRADTDTVDVLGNEQLLRDWREKVKI